ncbi:MAG TPA: DUF1360 domain-containing protein [Acidimicrobiales bacterium]
MTVQPAKKATRAVKKAAQSTSASKAASRPEGDPRPLRAYAAILASYAVLSGSLALGLRHKRFRLQALGPMDLVLYGLATEHLGRVITKDSVTAVLRSPFTRFKDPAGEGEVNEEVIGDGHRHAIGELISCPFCVAQWVATGLVAGSVGAPTLTTAVVSVSAAARASDYLQLLYGLLRKDQ